MLMMPCHTIIFVKPSIKIILYRDRPEHHNNNFILLFSGAPSKCNLYSTLHWTAARELLHGRFPGLWAMIQTVITIGCIGRYCFRPSAPRGPIIQDDNTARSSKDIHKYIAEQIMHMNNIVRIIKYILICNKH